MVSIIIPVYKVEKYLRCCLDSVLAQTYKDIQIILINDGSPDHSEDICLEYQQKDSRIEYHFKDNSGLGLTRNYGMQFINADSKYVMFLDSDDYIHPQSLEIMVNGIEREPDVSFIMGDYVQVSADSALGDHNMCFSGDITYEKYSMDDVLFKSLVNSDDQLRWMTCWNRLYRWDKVKDCKFHQSSPAEDIYFNNKVYLEGTSFLLVNKTLYFYRNNPDSIMRNTRVPSYFIPDMLRMEELVDMLPTSKCSLRNNALERLVRRYLCLLYSCKKHNSELYRQYPIDGYFRLYLRSKNPLKKRVLFSLFYYMPFFYSAFRDFSEWRGQKRLNIDIQS